MPWPEKSPGFTAGDAPISIGTTEKRHRYFEPPGDLNFPNNHKHSNCPSNWTHLSLLVLDPRNISTVSGLDDMFSNGATILGLWRVFTDLGGRPGSHLFVGTWASGDFTSLNGNNWVIVPGQGIVPGQQTGSWSLLYVLEQQLWADCCNEKRNVGLLSEWGYADPETNPYEWICNVSLQANGLIRSREADSMGVAWFYNGLSTDLKNLVSPLLDVRDVTGVEVYYNAAITPWFHLATDLQVVEPAEQDNRNTAFVLGLRAQIHL